MAFPPYLKAAMQTIEAVLKNRQRAADIQADFVHKLKKQ